MKILLATLLMLSFWPIHPALAANQYPLLIAQNTPPPLVSGQRVRVKKLTRDMAGVRKSIVTTGPSHFQDSTVVKAKQKRMKQFSDALKRYPQVNDPDVKAARAEYTALRQVLIDEFSRAKAQLAKIGNVQQNLATMEKNSRTYAVPAQLSIPFDEAAAKQWVAAAGNARTVAEHNHKQLKLIAELAYLPQTRGTPQNGAAYDLQDVKRMQRHAQGMFNQVQNTYQQMSQTLNNRLTQMETDLFARWQEDPEGEKKWIFLRDDSQKEAADLFAKNRAIAQSSVYLEKALNREPQLALATLPRIDQAQAAFEEKRQIALASSRLPAPKATDKQRLRIAQKIVETPKYEFGEHGPIVLTTEQIIERTREDSQIEIDDAELTLGGDLKMSGTQTTWTYTWEEFKFALPLKAVDDEQWHIWWITAKKFASGGPNTPIGRWVSGKASKGNPIPRQNF